MATALPGFTSTAIRATAPTNNRRPDPDCGGKTRSGNWWAPLFSWSSGADYITSPPPSAGDDPSRKLPSERSESESSRSRSGRFALRCFTEEKAKELRKKTLECSTFHDTMYHSAIASRLASDLGDR